MTFATSALTPAQVGNLQARFRVSADVKNRTSCIVGAAIQVGLTFAAAYLGRRWIAGFDVRGPFVLMSPYFAMTLFGLIASSNAEIEEEGKPSKSDSGLIQDAAIEYGLGPVYVGQRRSGSELTTFIRLENGKVCHLPKNWREFDAGARRFYVVRTLAPFKDRGRWAYLKSSSFYVWQLFGMVMAGLNLWTILVSHALTALWLAYALFGRLKQTVTREDLRALRLMKDLKAAISFVGKDVTNGVLGVSYAVRVEALRREAARLGIA